MCIMLVHIVYCQPMVVTETSCWKVDWDDLEKNQQLFKALCHSLLNKVPGSSNKE